jgi:probable phosphoglycerate mutase
MTRLLLIRHGRSAWNAEGRFQGLADRPLDDQGRQQAHRLAERLRREAPVALYTSPLLRAQETAEIIGRILGLPVVADERLKEYDIGDITGLTWEQMAERYPEVTRDWALAADTLAIPGEEGHARFRARVVAAFEEILSSHGDGTLGVVAHGGVFGAYLNHLLGRASRFSPFRFGNGSLSIVEPNPLRPRIVLLNDTCHLGGER